MQQGIYLAVFKIPCSIFSTNINVVVVVKSDFLYPFDKEVKLVKKNSEPIKRINHNLNGDALFKHNTYIWYNGIIN